MENNLPDFETMLETANPEDLAEMKKIIEGYISGIDAQIKKYDEELGQIVSEGERKLDEASGELDLLNANAQKKAEELATQQARDAIS